MSCVTLGVWTKIGWVIKESACGLPLLLVATRTDDGVGEAHHRCRSGTGMVCGWKQKELWPEGAAVGAPAGSHQTPVLCTLYISKLMKSKLNQNPFSCSTSCLFFPHRHTSALPRCESRLLRPLPQERWRLSRRPGRGGDLGHRLPAGGGHARSQGGGGDGGPGHSPLPQSGAAEGQGPRSGPQQAPEELSFYKLKL